MTGLLSLWMPIVISAVLVFVASSLIHMASPWHKSDFPKMPNEDAVMDALRPLGIAPGDYFFPRPAGRDDLKSPAFADRVARGPVALLTVMPGGISMGRNLALWFVYIIVIGVFSGYVAGRALPHGVPYLRVFQLAGATAFIGYSAALWQMSIWYHRSWKTTIKATVDGLIYAMLTAGTFGWLWPR